MQEAAMNAKIDAIYKSVEKTRKYMLWTGIITVAMIILPLIGLAFAIPSYLGTLNAATNGTDCTTADCLPF